MPIAQLLELWKKIEVEPMEIEKYVMTKENRQINNPDAELIAPALLPSSAEGCELLGLIEHTCHLIVQETRLDTAGEYSVYFAHHNDMR
ncbi:hypothetical protein ACRRTK_001556 [Alexandromys fortis]